MSTSVKFTLLACLYFSQGLPYGFFTQALPVMMRERGASLPQIGLATLVVLPWALKFLWAPLVDRYGSRRLGRRKSWLIPLQMAGVLLFIGLGLVRDTQNYTYLLIGFFLASLIAATQDIAADGLAVQLLTLGERGIGNGLQVAGYRVGMVLGGGYLLYILPQLGWHGAFFTMSACLLLATVPLLLVKEPPEPSKHRPRLLEILKRVFARHGFLAWLLLIAFYKFGDAMTSGMVRPFLVDYGLDISEIGALLGTVGFVSGLLGALIGGVLTRYLGRLPAILWFGVIQALSVWAYLLITTQMVGYNGLMAIAAMEYFTGGLATVALFTAMMDVADPEAGATDYTVQASMVVIATILAGIAAGFVAETIGYAGNFAVSGSLSLLGALVLVWVYRKQYNSPLALHVSPNAVPQSAC